MTDAADSPTYADAPEALIALWEQRRDPLGFVRGDVLGPADVDLAALAERRLPEVPPPPPRRMRGHGQKMQALREELAGSSELALLNGICIAHLRKRSFPDHVPALFRRIWAEQGAVLRAELPVRWLISSATTFADHGESEAQRRLGQSLNILFSLMKLYEYERVTAGFAPSEPVQARRAVKHPLPLGMPAFSLLSGGLDVNLLAPIWQEAQGVPVLGPLALLLLERLNDDPGTLFRRLKRMRAATAEVRGRRRAAAALRAAQFPPDP